MADKNTKNTGTDRTNLSEQSIRSLSSAVGSLAQQIKTLSVNTGRVASRGVLGASRIAGDAARNVGGALYDMKSEYGMSVSGGLGVGVASAVNPFAGELVKRIVERNEGSLSNAFRSMMDSSKSMLSFMKQKVSSSKEFDDDYDYSHRRIHSVKKQKINQIAETTKPKKRKKRRLTPDSYNNMYGSGDEIEALDRLRISNATWLKAVGTLTKKELKSKPLPKAKRGGIVLGTGRAIVHEGEAIIPAKALVGQYAVLKDIKSSMETQTTALTNISGVLGSGESLFMKGLTSAIDSVFKNSPLMNSMSKMSLGISGMILDLWRFKAISGPAARYARYVLRRTPLETIAQASTSSYGEFRYYLPKMTEALNNILEFFGGTKVKIKARSEGVFGQGKSFKDRLKRLAITGDIMSFLMPEKDLDDDEEPTSTSNKSSRWSRFKSKFSKKKPVVSQAMIMGHMTDVSSNKLSRDLLNSDPAAAINIQQTKKTNGLLSKLLNTENKSLKLDTIDNRDESHYQSLHMRWLRNNESIGGQITGWFTKFLLPVVSTIGAVVASIGGLFGIGTGGVKGWKGLKMAFGSTKAGSSILNFFNKLRGADVAGEVGVAAKDGKIASRIATIARESKVVQGVLGALKGAKGGSKFLRILGIGSKVAGTVALPILVVTSIIDGFMGWFKAGKIFEVVEPTIKQRFAAAGGSILEGLFEIIRMPINLVMKMIGSDKRIPDLTSKFSILLHDVISVVEPFFKGTWTTFKFIGKGLSISLGAIVDYITFIPRLLMDPKKTIDDTVKRIKEIGLYFIEDIPNYLSDMFGVVIDSFFKLAEMGNKWVEWGRDKLTDMFFDMSKNWSTFLPSVWEKVKSATLGVFDYFITGLIKLGSMARHWVIDKLNPLGLGQWIASKWPEISDKGYKIGSSVASSLVSAASSASQSVSNASSELSRSARMKAVLFGDLSDPILTNRAVKGKAGSEAASEKRAIEAQQRVAETYAQTSKKQLDAVVATSNHAVQTVINNNNTSMTNNTTQPKLPYFNLLYGGSSGTNMGLGG